MATATSGLTLPLVIVSPGLELAITKMDRAASLSTWNLDVVWQQKSKFYFMQWSLRLQLNLPLLCGYFLSTLKIVAFYLRNGGRYCYDLLSQRASKRSRLLWSNFLHSNRIITHSEKLAITSSSCSAPLYLCTAVLLPGLKCVLVHLQKSTCCHPLVVNGKQKRWPKILDEWNNRFRSPGAGIKNAIGLSRQLPFNLQPRVKSDGANEWRLTRKRKRQVEPI